MKVALRVCFALTVIFSAQNPAIGSGLTAMELLRQCEGREPPEAPHFGQIACVFYVMGIIDGVQMTAVEKSNKRLVCTPAQGISNEQGVKIFVKWANNNPEQLHESARMGVFIAFMQAFPCPTSAR